MFPSNVFKLTAVIHFVCPPNSSHFSRLYVVISVIAHWNNIRTVTFISYCGRNDTESEHQRFWIKGPTHSPDSLNESWILLLYKRKILIKDKYALMTVLTADQCSGCAAYTRSGKAKLTLKLFLQYAITPPLTSDLHRDVITLTLHHQNRYDFTLGPLLTGPFERSQTLFVKLIIIRDVRRGCDEITKSIFR